MTYSGLVVKSQSGFFWVELADERVIICRLRGRLMEEAQSSAIAAIGDRVTISILDDGSGMVESVEARHNVLSRAARTEGNRGGGAAEREQVIIANVEQAFFVFAAAQPSPTFKNVDRFLVTGEKAQIDHMRLVVNKIDLLGDDEESEKVRRRFENYREIGYTVVYTSAIEAQGIDELRQLLVGRLSVFTGPSGVGKTSLLNAIQQGLARSVKQVSNWSQEGQHTTRDSALVKLDFGGYLADTPGLRTLTMWDIEPDELDAYYREIAPLVASCRFGDCTHRDEPGCAVRKAVEAGEITRYRYRSYLGLRGELEAAFENY